MMAFNPAAAFNAQLLAASQPSTPVKAESSNSVAPTSHSDLANDAIRFLNASGPLLTPGIPGFPHPMNAEVAAFRAAVAQGAVPFPAMYSGMHPGEMKPEMMGAAAGAVPGFFFDASLGYHPYAGGLDGARRKNATRETTAPLKSWLNEHRKNPYPTKAEKIMLALLTKMTLTQVSTWFANARRRLKKENKMTWSPRNRPGEDDDDDLADIDASERDPCDRPSSSTSNISDIGGGGGGGASVKPEVSSSVSNGNNNNEKGTHHHHPHQYVPTTTTTESNISNSPRKAKIWSIAETLSRDDMNSTESKKDSASSNASTSVDSGEYDSINIHASSTSSASSSTTTLPTTATSATTIPLTSSASSSSSSVASSLSGATMAANVLSTDGMPHQAPFLPQFNPWQQQMAFAMSRMPFPRPDILAAMAQAGQLRPPQMLFNPLLMGSTLTIPHSLASATVTPTSHMNSNGALMWCERRSTSPNSSSTHSATGGGGGGGGGGTMNNSSMEPTEHDKS